MDPRINLCHIQLLREGTVGATWSWIQPHFDVSPPKWLDPAAKEYMQEVHPYQTLLPQLLKGLLHGLQLA
jgi:hypothetical protein